MLHILRGQALEGEVEFAKASHRRQCFYGRLQGARLLFGQWIDACRQILLQHAIGGRRTVRRQPVGFQLRNRDHEIHLAAAIDFPQRIGFADDVGGGLPVNRQRSIRQAASAKSLIAGPSLSGHWRAGAGTSAGRPTSCAWPPSGSPPARAPALLQSPSAPDAHFLPCRVCGFRPASATGGETPPSGKALASFAQGGAEMDRARRNRIRRR